MQGRMVASLIALILVSVTFTGCISLEDDSSDDHAMGCLVEADVVSGVAPLDVNLTLTTSFPDGTIDLWQLTWYGPDPEIMGGDGEPPATVGTTFEDEGTYHILLVIILDDGSATVNSTIVTVLPSDDAPSCQISADVTAGAAPLSVNLTMTADDADDIVSTMLEVLGPNDGTFVVNGSVDAIWSWEHQFNETGEHVVTYHVTYDTHVVNDSVTIRVTSGQLITYVIDVGQGDAILVQTPDARNMLIDAGDNDHAASLVTFLDDHSVETIDCFVLTHPHADHIGGADEVLDSFNVSMIYHPGYDYDTVTYHRFIDAADDEGCPIHTDDDTDPGDAIAIDNAVNMTILSIDSHADNANDASIVIKMTFGTVDYLFTGDIGFDVEDAMLPAFDLDVEILKVSHHGSAYATSTEFLAEATPLVAMISVGVNNTYGHPADETVSRLETSGADVHRTDVDGTITVTSDGSTWTVVDGLCP